MRQRILFKNIFYIYVFDWNLALNLQDNDKLYVFIQLCFFDACNLALGTCLEWFLLLQGH